MDDASSPSVHQPDSFAFTPENLTQARKVIARYPAGKQASAVMPLLMLAQKQNSNWLPRAAMDTVAAMLGMAPIRVYEVATFYTMYNLAPVGKHFMEICTTTPCWLKGSEEIVKACERHLGVKLGETTADGQFTLKEAECLGACVNAPMVQINADYYEDLDAASFGKILDAMAAGKKTKPGPQTDRQLSAPIGGQTTLTDKSLFPTSHKLPQD